MAESDPAQRPYIHERRHRFLHPRKQHARAGVIQQRLIIPHEELTELEIELIEEGSDAEQVRGDFGDLRHNPSRWNVSGIVPGRATRFNRSKARHVREMARAMLSRAQGFL